MSIDFKNTTGIPEARWVLSKEGHLRLQVRCRVYRHGSDVGYEWIEAPVMEEGLDGSYEELADVVVSIKSWRGSVE